MAADGVVPDVRDGLTPGCRCALRALGRSAQFRPGARVVDDALRMSGRAGRRRAIYAELVRMARAWELRHPLVDAHGNLGSINGDEAAGWDHTQLRLAAAGAELLGEEDDEDDAALAARLPNLLVNGSFAVATGVASGIPPHNLHEVAAAAIAYIDEPAIDVDGLLEHVAGPDFPTGAIVARDGLRDAYATGRGTLTLRARTHVEPRPRGGEALVITELPFGVVTGGRGGLVGELVRAVKGRRIAGVAAVDERSDERHGLRIVLDLEPDAAPEQVLERLCAHTRLQTTFELRLVAAVAGAERTLSLRDAVAHHVEHRRDAVARRTGLRDADRILDVVREELQATAEQHGDERRSQIV